MKFKIFSTILVLSLFSCSGNNDVFPSKITLEEAKRTEFISFDVDDRNIFLTVFKSDPSPFAQEFAWIDDIDFDANTQSLIKRGIYANVPEEQSTFNNIETFGLEFNQVFDNTDIDTNTNRLFSNEKFKSEFLTTGAQSLSKSNFGLHQTFLIGSGHPTQSTMTITKIEHIVDHDNLIFVTGEFEGTMGIEITNGHFKLIIEN